MKRFRQTMVVALALLSTTARGFASSGTEGASFLDIPVGAGPASMGSAYTALANDAYAPVWNPAGLGNLDSTQLAGQHLSYLESIHYEYFGAVHPLKGGKSGIGGSIQYLGSGDIDATAEGTGASLGTYSSRWAAYTLSYGRSLSDKLSLGLSGKMINAKIDDVSASAFAGDIGTLYKVSPKLTLAGTVVNMGSKLKFLEEGDSLPLAFKLAAVMQPTSALKISAEGVHRKSGLTSGHFGAQWKPLEMLSLRTGYKTDTLKELSAMAGLTAGLGIHFWNQELAYAWVPFGDLGDTHYISLLLRFGDSETLGRNSLIRSNSIKRHRSVRSQKKDDDADPEYLQLMQLLGEDDGQRIGRAPGNPKNEQ